MVYFILNSLKDIPVVEFFFDECSCYVLTKDISIF